VVRTSRSATTIIEEKIRLGAGLEACTTIPSYPPKNFHTIFIAQFIQIAYRGTVCPIPADMPLLFAYVMSAVDE
jgi:hypothetical protein